MTLSQRWFPKRKGKKELEIQTPSSSSRVTYQSMLTVIVGH